MCAVLAAEAVRAQPVMTEGRELAPDVSAARGEIVINLQGDLWALPVSGGAATLLAETDAPAARPRWSPDGRQIVYQSEAGMDSRIHLHDVDSGDTTQLGVGGAFERHPAWHPSGERIVFASARADRGFDLWETDLATGLEWRLTQHPDDDVEPAWSADGRHLTWVRRGRNEWTLMLRRFGRPAEVLLRSDRPIRAPSFRPDGTLITYFHAGSEAFELRMVILSDPPLDRVLANEEGLYPAPIAWLDRNRYVYSLDSELRSRGFDEWRGRPVFFRAAPRPVPAAPAFRVADRALPAREAADEALVIRAGRVFDGLARSYREGVDVRIENGVIADITERREWDDAPVIELSSTTLLPGFIDLQSRMPPGDPERAGAALLAWGVTTIVATLPEDFDPGVWSTETSPGPRLLASSDTADAPPDDTADLDGLPYLVVADGAADARDVERVHRWQSLGVPVYASSWALARRLNTYLLPASTSVSGTAFLEATGRPSFRRETIDLNAHQLVSTLADRRTHGVAALFEQRQAAGLEAQAPRGSRRPLLEDLRRSRQPIVLGSAGNGLPPGLSVHAEFLALASGGLANDQVLKSAGRHAAAVLGLRGRLGEISVGAKADFVLVNGDPLADIRDAGRIVAVVADGRFLSLVSLLDRMPRSVE